MNYTRRVPLPGAGTTSRESPDPGMLASNLGPLAPYYCPDGEETAAPGNLPFRPSGAALRASKIAPGDFVVPEVLILPG